MASAPPPGPSRNKPRPQRPRFEQGITVGARRPLFGACRKPRPWPGPFSRAREKEFALHVRAIRQGQKNRPGGARGKTARDKGRGPEVGDQAIDPIVQAPESVVWLRSPRRHARACRVHPRRPAAAMLQEMGVAFFAGVEALSRVDNRDKPGHDGGGGEARTGSERPRRHREEGPKAIHVSAPRRVDRFAPLSS